MNTLSFRDVLTCKVWIGSLDRMYQYACELGYEYFLWNDRVYRIPPKLGGKPEVIDTGLTVSDVR